MTEERRLVTVVPRFDARPLVARAELELGQLTGDQSLVESGTAALEASAT